MQGQTRVWDPPEYYDEKKTRSELSSGLVDKPLPPPPPGSSLRTQLLAGAGWAFLGRIFLAFLSVATNALLARMLTPQEFGVYLLAYSIVMMGSALGMLGLNQAIVRFIAESIGLNQPWRARRTAGIAFLLALFGAVGTASLFYAASGFVANRLLSAPALASIAGLVAVWMAVLVFRRLAAEAFRGFHDIRLASLFGGPFSCFLLLASLAVLSRMREARLSTVILLAIVSIGASVALSGSLLWGRIARTLARSESDSHLWATEPCIAAILRVSLPLMVVHVVGYSLTQLDLWILGMYRPEAEVAVYGAVMRLMHLVALPLVVVNLVVSPIIAEMNAQGRTSKLERVLRGTATLAGLPAMLALLAMGLGARIILETLFGEFYGQGASVLIVLACGQFMFVCAGTCGLTLMMTGHQLAAMIATLLSGLYLVLAGIWVVQVHGMIGMAVVSASALALHKVLLLVLARRLVGVWTHVSLSREFLVQALRFVGLSRRR